MNKAKLNTAAAILTLFVALLAVYAMAVDAAIDEVAHDTIPQISTR